MNNNYNKSLYSKASRSVESSSVFLWKSAHLFHPLLMVASPCALYQPQVSNFHLRPFPSPGPALMSTLGRLFLHPHLPQPLPLHGQLDYYISLMLLLDTLKTQGSQLCSIWPGLVFLMFLVLGTGHAFAHAVTRTPGLEFLPHLCLHRNNVLTKVTLLPITHLHSLPRCLRICSPPQSIIEGAMFLHFQHMASLPFGQNCLFKE